MQLGLFLSKGGSALWTIDDNEDIHTVLLANGFPSVRTSVSDDGIFYAEINYDALDLDGFYLTTDADVSDKDVWQIINVPMFILELPEFLNIFHTLTNTRFTGGPF